MVLGWELRFPPLPTLVPPPPSLLNHGCNRLPKVAIPGLPRHDKDTDQKWRAHAEYGGNVKRFHHSPKVVQAEKGMLIGICIYR